MQRRHLFVFCAALAWTASAVAQSAPTAIDKPARLVMQVSDSDSAKWNLVMNNAHNVQKALGAKNVEIEIVAFGPGIQMVTLDSAVASRVTEMVEQGVKVFACENTMTGLKLAKEDMNPTVGYVVSGVVEIMQKQSQGWAYIKP